MKKLSHKHKKPPTQRDLPDALVKESKLKKGPSFPVVAIGASVGGLKAVTELFENLPDNTGMAYIYVQHLSPNHKSFLPSILSRTTKMKVQKIDNMELMKPDNVYVIPNDKGIVVTDGHIKLIPRSKSGEAISVDTLFSSLAQTHKENVIGIVLSGNAHDGTIGLKAIKDAGGLTFAQDDSAEARGMPTSVIATGVVDFVLSPKEIALELGSYKKNGFKILASKHKPKADPVILDTHPDMKSIFALLRKKVNVDFSRYKMATMRRRINHRMAQSEVKTIKEYESFLHKNKDEINILYNDLLINVTSFFRDPKTFRYLKSTILPKLINKKKEGEMLRIWIPACSTGEEVYSIAMLIIELQDKMKVKLLTQIFATDLSDGAIQEARIGEFLKSDLEHVGHDRINRFFTKTGENYCIVKEVREMCVFAPHNILRDPPFFRMDLVSCCNLLIYFDTDAQKRALATVHFALNDGGYLMLGKSETTGASSQLFTQVNNKFKIYCRKPNSGKRVMPVLSPRFEDTSIRPEKIGYLPKKAKKAAAVNADDIDRVIDTTLLQDHMPACAIINKDMEILSFRGSTSLFLTHNSGKASLNILKMTRPEFALELRNAINSVIKTKQPVIKSGIEMNSHVVAATYQIMSLEVSILKVEQDEPLLLVVFKLQEKIERYSTDGKDGKHSSTQKDRRIKKLTEELSNAGSEMRSVVEAQETAYEDLQAANEEIVSTNEEFQTLNEELETSKEEIEATNEELISTNQELQLRNDLLAESNNYSETIFATIHEPMIVLDSNLHVKSANKSFYKKFHVNKEETEGVLLFDLGNKQWEIPKLHELLENITLKNSHFENFEVTHVFPGLGKKVMLLNANRIIQKTHGEKLILLAIEDITERHSRQRKEKEYLKKDIRIHRRVTAELEKAVKRRTKQLLQKNIELESANKDLTTFTYVSSHDLQEPLRKLQNFVAYIIKKEQKNLSDEGKGYFQRIQETAKRMQALIEDLLTYARTKSNERVFEKVDLNIILDEVKHSFEELILKKKAILKYSMCDVNVVSFQFRQLFQNLISNSLKFSLADKAPRITIKSNIVKGSRLNIKTLSPKVKYCHIIYTDNGIGFDPQYQDRIFEVFQRLHSYETYSGTGIGLAICKRIVENHNGVITATGQLNKGARFDIYIPVT